MDRIRSTNARRISQVVNPTYLKPPLGARTSRIYQKADEGREIEGIPTPKLWRRHVGVKFRRGPNNPPSSVLNRSYHRRPQSFVRKTDMFMLIIFIAYVTFPLRRGFKYTVWIPQDFQSYHDVTISPPSIWQADWRVTET